MTTATPAPRQRRRMLRDIDPGDRPRLAAELIAMSHQEFYAATTRDVLADLADAVMTAPIRRWERQP